MSARVASNYPFVRPGMTYTLIARVKAATVQRNVQLQLSWRDNVGNVVGVTTGSALIAATTTGWTQLVFSDVPPAGATRVQPVLSADLTQIGEAFYFDTIALFETASAPTVTPTWSAGGVPVILNRAATGKKLALVDRPMFLFGFDDYMECADHDKLDFAAVDPFTLTIALKKYGGSSTEDLISKGFQPGAATNAGYSLWYDNGVLKSALRIADGTVGNTGVSSGLAIYGLAELIVGQRNIGTDEVQLRGSTGALLGAANDPTTASLANTSVLRIGAAAPAVAANLDAEFLGASIHRSALIAADIAALDAEMGTNV